MHIGLTLRITTVYQSLSNKKMIHIAVVGNSIVPSFVVLLQFIAVFLQYYYCNKQEKVETVLRLDMLILQLYIK